jgi:hypothetical protein
VGWTFQADHISANGIVSSSSIDHVYSSEIIKGSIKVKKLPNSATDHLPVITQYSLDKNKVKYKHSITKRSYKTFTKERWNKSQASQDWSGLNKCEGVDQMVNIFDKNIAEALNEVVPVKTFTVRSNHKFGLSESTKDLMKKRDKTRNAIKDASSQERPVLIQQINLYEIELLIK